MCPNITKSNDRGANVPVVSECSEVTSSVSSASTVRPNQASHESTTIAFGQEARNRTHPKLLGECTATTASGGGVLGQLSTPFQTDYLGSHTLTLERLAMVTIELAGFVHGSVACAVSLTLPKGRAVANLYSHLTMWKDECATCGAPVACLPSRGTTSDRVDVSVEMYDIRVGDHRIRSTISQNRPYVYSCFATMFGPQNYESSSFAAFFFYFSSLHHAGCKFVRGRKTVLA